MDMDKTSTMTAEDSPKTLEELFEELSDEYILSML